MLNDIRKLIKFETHRQVRFWDDRNYKTKRSLHKLFKHWRRHQACIEESDLSFGFYEGGDFLDVGAFKGYYSALLAPKAKPGAHFVSVEPDPGALPALFGNIAGLAQTFPHIKFSVLNVICGYGDIAKVDDYGHPCYRSTPTSSGGMRAASVDGLCEGLALKPSFIKIDVEGAEDSVLQGASKTLEHVGKVVIELHPDWFPPQVSVEAIREGLASRSLIKKHALSRDTQSLEWYGR